jgi:general secretion pathway protein L
MILEFLAWWGRQLAALLPQYRNEAVSLPADALVVTPALGAGDPLAVEIAGRSHGRITSLGTFVLDQAGIVAARSSLAPARRPAAVILQLDAGQLLEKELALPLAAEHNLDQVLAFEMDRETPFSAEEVYWDAAVIGRDRGLGRILVRLSLVPRAAVSDLVDALRAAGLGPSRLAAALPDGALRAIALDHAGRIRSGWRGRAAPILAAACAVLALAAIGLPFLRQAQAIGAVDAQIAALQPGVDEAAVLRNRISGSGNDAIAALRAQTPDALRVLAAATDALPDDTYLLSLALKDGKLSLSGRSVSAAPLLGALAANGAFTDPSFAAPVTMEGDGTLQAFSIDARARP